jgi:hypothetical protein
MARIRCTYTIGGMVQLAIRCHPRAPVSLDELEGWLEQQVDELRAAAPGAILRLLRLTQGGPASQLEIGWLVELELADGAPLLAGPRLADSLTDMRLLGLQPTLLAPCALAQTAVGKNSRAPGANAA